MDTIEQDIFNGGYDSIDTQYHNLIEYNVKKGGTISYRRRVGGQTKLNMMDNIINMGLIDQYYLTIDDESNGESNLPGLKKEFLQHPYEPETKRKFYCSFPHIAQESSYYDNKDTKSKKDITMKDMAMCREIADLFGITIDHTDELSFILKALKDIYTKSDRIFVKETVEKFGLKTIVVDALCRLHESIVSQYWRIIQLYINKYPNKAKVRKSKKEYPLNYSKNLILIKDVKYRSKNDGLNTKLKKIQGFCPFEPIIRIYQLLDFPINILIKELTHETLSKIPDILLSLSSLPNDLNTKTMSLREPTLTNTAELIHWYAKNIMVRQKKLQHYVIKYEQHYINIAETLTNFANYLESCNPNIYNQLTINNCKSVQHQL